MSDVSGVPEDRAVIDRIVDGVTAVLLVGADEREVAVPIEVLPTGARERDWVVIDPAADPVQVLAVDSELTEQRSRQVITQLERIREQQSGGRFPRR